MLTADEFLQTLEQLDDPAEQRRLVEREASWLTDDTVQRMKARANDLLRSDTPLGLALADHILYASKVSGNPVHRALGLMVQANALMWRGEQREAIVLYDEARQTALAAGNEIEATRSQVGKIAALMNLGEHQQALEVAQQTGDTLLSYNEVVSAATAYTNAASCYNILNQFEQALSYLYKAQRLLQELATPAAQKTLGLVYYTLSTALRGLGRYQQALEWAEEASSNARQYGLVINEATFQAAGAVCYYWLGDFNKALRILHASREVFVRHGLMPNLIDCDRFIATCYLELGHYEQAVEQAQAVIELLQARDLTRTPDYARAYLLLGLAYSGLGELDEAAQALETTRQITEQTGVANLRQHTDVRLAEIYLARQQPAQAAALLAGILPDLNNALHLTPLAQLLLGRIAASQNDYDEAVSLTRQAISSFETQGIQGRVYQCYYQLAEISEKQGNLAEALTHLNRAIESLEHLRGRIASETRSVFLRSKEGVYEAAVTLSLASGEVEQAFGLAERVKSRALAELVGQQLDIRVRVRDEADRPLVEEIEGLRAQHNDLTQRLARWQTELASTPPLNEEERQTALKQALTCEKKLAALTHTLQVRNAHYAEDATLAPSYQPFDKTLLEPDEALVEYYVARGELLAFVTTSKGQQVVRQLSTLPQLNRQLTFFRLNLAATVKNLADINRLEPSLFANRLEGFVTNSRALLQKLHAALFAPLTPLLAGYKRLLLVPHGSLHYLPFHALYDGATNSYLLETFEEITYLPAASLLRFCRERARQERGVGALVYAYSNEGALPCTLEEARLVAATLGCEARLEEAANLGSFRTEATSKKIIHLAAHGQYREDAPLFSSLLLAGGDLTVHEIFNMEWQASLVTLSACDSGLGAPGGGDEAQGLSRACLYAGASSLALSLWRVDDRAGSLLMQEFYRNLLAGQSKAAALRQAQLTLLQNPNYRHPFYWAPYILIGDNGPL